MTDKEIIVNDVDVNEYRYSQTISGNVKCECEYEAFNGEIETFDECKNYPTCYYKQLKRKEQECEELKFNEKNFRIDAARAKMKASKYKQALDEIVQVISNYPSKGIQEILQTQMEYTQTLLSVSETKLQKILGIINKAKENIND